jgi:mitochondrial distribution and morphology protein 31
MPHFHRPTKEELLAAATGFWSRLKIRFKWFSIRSVRPFNIDEITGFISWIVVGHLLWIVIGTTTFFSLAILAINTVFAQETLARWVGSYLTKSTGINVVFESAIVPEWRSGVIKFENVFVSRRPGQTDGAGVSKGTRERAAAAAAAANADPNEDTNFTQFDLSINEVLVTLSFAKWFNSKGILQNVEVKGMRGVVDRTNVHWTGEYVDPKSYRHEHNPGDFEIDSFKMEDVLVALHQPKGFRPFTVSIFSADLPQLRKRWLFYDVLSANQMHGAFDNSLFTIHPHQNHSYIGTQDTDDRNNPWKKRSRIRVDGVNIDHLNRGVEGPFSWIHEGNVDIVADIMFPADSDESVLKVMSDFYERMEAALTEKKRHPIAPDGTEQETEDDKRFLVMDLRIHLNDVRAAVPLFTRDLSYVNNALIRPIVAYINSRRTFIPINCRVVKRASDFDGSWSLFDSGLMDDLSAEVSSSSSPNTPQPPPWRCVKPMAQIFPDSPADIRSFCFRRHRRPGTLAAYQEGGTVVPPGSHPGNLHGHGGQYCLNRLFCSDCSDEMRTAHEGSRDAIAYARMFHPPLPVRETCIGMASLLSSIYGEM